MDQQTKALKSALIAIVILAAALVGYYWYAKRARTTENDVNFQEKTETPAASEAGSEYAGVYTSSEAVEGLERRLGFFAVNKKEDGTPGFTGTAKMDKMATTVDSTIYVPCPNVSVGEGEFFIKCADAEVGQISFVGESKSGSITGKLLWSKDGVVVVDKATTLVRTTNN